MGKPRRNFRLCRICRKDNKSDPANPLIQVCNCAAAYVHHKCQEDLMTSKGEITCGQCKAQYQEIRYAHTNKNILHYLWEESSARSDLMKGVSMLMSMFFTIATLTKTYFFDPEGLLEEVASLELSFDMESLMHNINIVMLLHIKLILPIVSIYFTVSTVKSLVEDFHEWKRTHFNVTVHEWKPRPKSSEKQGIGKKSKSNKPGSRCKSK